MGEILTYSLSSSLVLILLYLAYPWVKAPEHCAAFNRRLLWGIYIVALLSPALYGVVGKMTESSSGQGGIMIQLEHIATQPITPEAEERTPIFSLLLWTYLAGAVVVAGLTAINFSRILQIINNGHRVYLEGRRIILTDRKDVAPFSFAKYIVIPSEEPIENIRLILLHEESHIALGHWLDLLFAQIVCIFQWYNPAAWMMQAQLKNVHEYQADHRVVNSGTDIRQYQLLLIEKAVGARFPSLANSLNHSKLKKRITMMCNQRKPRGGRLLRPLLLLPTLGAALWMVDLPAVAAAMNSIAESSLIAPRTDSASKVIKSIPEPKQKASKKSNKKSSQPYMAVEKVAEFPGGMKALKDFMKKNIKYPENIGVSGRVIVRFVVEADGSIGDVSIVKSVAPELDAEAERVVKMMPRWIPGEVDGKPVASYFNIPVNFETEPATETTAAVADSGEIDDKSPSTSKSVSTSVSTTTTSDGNKETTITVTSDSNDDHYSVSVNSSGLKQNEYVVYLDGQKYEGDFSDIPSSQIEAMSIEKHDDAPSIIRITLKK